MAKHDIDPVLKHLVHAVNESDTAGVPVTVSAHGTIVTGDLIAERRYFAKLVEANPLLNALQPSTGLLGKNYARDTEAESDYYLHMLASPTAENGTGLCRISLESIDSWSLREPAATGGSAEEASPFARFLGAS
jgi:hypothetical protein